MKHIATLMGKTISEIKRDGDKVTFYDQDANPIFTVIEQAPPSGSLDAFYDGEGNYFNMEIEMEL